MVKAVRSSAVEKTPDKVPPAEVPSEKSPPTKTSPAKVLSAKTSSKTSSAKAVADRAAADKVGLEETPSPRKARARGGVEPAAKKPVAKKPSAVPRSSPKVTAGGGSFEADRASPAIRKQGQAAKAETKTIAKPAPASLDSARKTSAEPARKKASRPTVAGLTQGAPIDLGFLSGFVSFHLRLAQDASYRAFARIKDKDLIKPGRFPALAIIHLNPGISQSALGRAIARDKSTVSPLIKDLQNNGLISRKPSPSDRRSVTLVLTKKGERSLDRLHARALEHEDDLDKLVGASKSRLVGMLDKITGGFAAT